MIQMLSMKLQQKILRLQKTQKKQMKKLHKIESKQAQLEKKLKRTNLLVFILLLFTVKNCLHKKGK